VRARLCRRGTRGGKGTGGGTWRKPSGSFDFASQGARSCAQDDRFLVGSPSEISCELLVADHATLVKEIPGGNDRKKGKCKSGGSPAICSGGREQESVRGCAGEGVAVEKGWAVVHRRTPSGSFDSASQKTRSCAQDDRLLVGSPSRTSCGLVVAHRAAG